MTGAKTAGLGTSIRHEQTARFQFDTDSDTVTGTEVPWGNKINVATVTLALQQGSSLTGVWGQ